MSKRILVTGAASGTGEAVAIKLAAEGHSLVVMDVDATGLEAIVSRLGSRTRSFVGSVAELAACEGAVRLAVDAFGGLDGVSHNAGIQRYGDAVNTSIESW